MVEVEGEGLLGVVFADDVEVVRVVEVVAREFGVVVLAG